MVTSSETQATPIDFDDLDMSMHRAKIDADPAETHGELCGLLCAQVAVNAGDWIDGEILPHATPNGELTQCRDLLHQLWRQTQAQLDDPECSFRLLLPDDEQPLGLRSQALGSWCEGFLYGLGQLGQAWFEALSEESREFISDLTEISRIEIDPEESEIDEVAFTEVVEYVRMGVLMLHEEEPLRNKTPDGETLH